MLIQILTGTFVIFLTVIIQVVFIGTAIELLGRNKDWFIQPPFLFKTIIVMVAVVLWLILGISLSAWSWAGVFLLAGLFDALEPALYFSIVTFTTLGYGDITIDPQWRILASFAAVDGLIVFGLNTAFLVEFTSRMRSSQERSISHET